MFAMERKTLMNFQTKNNSQHFILLSCVENANFHIWWTFQKSKFIRFGNKIKYQKSKYSGIR